MGHSDYSDIFCSAGRADPLADCGYHSTEPLGSPCSGYPSRSKLHRTMLSSSLFADGQSVTSLLVPCVYAPCSEGWLRLFSHWPGEATRVWSLCWGEAALAAAPVGSTKRPANGRCCSPLRLPTATSQHLPVPNRQRSPVCRASYKVCLFIPSFP